MKSYLAKLVNGEDLTRGECSEAFEKIMSGEATGAQIGCFLTALSMKGETVDEIIGAATIMRAKVKRVAAPAGCIDTCGTGGDKLHTFNISTAAALVAAAAGVPVAKHGNRSVTSKSGSAEVLTALGVNIEAPLEVVERCLKEVGFGFCFAPLFHPAMKYAIGPRREMGVRTIFNILGPLTNPAGADRQIMGVFDADRTAQLANVLGGLGSKRAMVVHGRDGLDELSTMAPTRVSEWVKGSARHYEIKAGELGLPEAKLEDLQVSTDAESADVIREVLRDRPGPARDIVILNTAAALIVADKASGWPDAVALAGDTLASGQPAQLLDKLVRISNDRS